MVLSSRLAAAWNQSRMDRYRRSHVDDTRRGQRQDLQRRRTAGSPPALLVSFFTLGTVIAASGAQ